MHFEEKNILKAGCGMMAIAAAIYGVIATIGVAAIIAIIYAIKVIWGTP